MASPLWGSPRSSRPVLWALALELKTIGLVVVVVVVGKMEQHVPDGRFVLEPPASQRLGADLAAVGKEPFGDHGVVHRFLLQDR